MRSLWLVMGCVVWLWSLPCLAQNPIPAPVSKEIKTVTKTVVIRKNVIFKSLDVIADRKDFLVEIDGKPRELQEKSFRWQTSDLFKVGTQVNVRAELPGELRDVKTIKIEQDDTTTVYYGWADAQLTVLTDRPGVEIELEQDELSKAISGDKGYPISSDEKKKIEYGYLTPGLIKIKAKFPALPDLVKVVELKSDIPSTVEIGWNDSEIRILGVEKIYPRLSFLVNGQPMKGEYNESRKSMVIRGLPAGHQVVVARINQELPPIPVVWELDTRPSTTSEVRWPDYGTLVITSDRDNVEATLMTSGQALLASYQLNMGDRVVLNQLPVGGRLTLEARWRKPDGSFLPFTERPLPVEISNTVKTINVAWLNVSLEVNTDREAFVKIVNKAGEEIGNGQTENRMVRFSNLQPGLVRVIATADDRTQEQLIELVPEKTNYADLEWEEYSDLTLRSDRANVEMKVDGKSEFTSTFAGETLKIKHYPLKATKPVEVTATWKGGQYPVELKQVGDSEKVADFRLRDSILTVKFNRKGIRVRVQDEVTGGKEQSYTAIRDGESYRFEVAAGKVTLIGEYTQGLGDGASPTQFQIELRLQDKKTVNVKIEGVLQQVVFGT